MGCPHEGETTPDPRLSERVAHRAARRRELLLEEEFYSELYLSWASVIGYGRCMESFLLLFICGW